MREPLTLAQVKAVLDSAAKSPLDPGLQEMIPTDLLIYLQAAPDVSRAISQLEEHYSERQRAFADLNLALVEYANASGQGQLMLDNVRLCLEQVRARRMESGDQESIGRQGKG